MIVIIRNHQFRQGKDLIEMIKCEVMQDGTRKEVWIASWEVVVDTPIELSDEAGNKSIWMITKILTP